MRRRLTIAQRARLGELEHQGWRLLFVRGEQAVAFVAHEQRGYGMLPREGRLLAVRSLTVRSEDAAPAPAPALGLPDAGSVRVAAA